ncbi:hypothetical protein WJS89_05665 [Sphingomicrobium sp. XHP0235]|uniref:hypothetical protein n=1 Tax=Sphingomicrobium aquimarinum TaxID=3133971 RepID=UPI0031FEF519
MYFEDIRQAHARGVSSGELHTGVSLEAIVRSASLGLSSGRQTSPETAGLVLLASSDFRRVDDIHLAAPFIRLLPQLESAEEIEARLRWMVHAGTTSSDPDRRSRSNEAADLIMSQLAVCRDEFEWEGSDVEASFDFGCVAWDLARLREKHPRLIDAALRGDLHNVTKVLASMSCEDDYSVLTQGVAQLIMCWDALYLQTEACLSWRALRPGHHGIVVGYVPVSYIGGVLRRATDQYSLASELNQVFEKNRADGIDRIDDKRTINKWERQLQRLGFDPIAISQLFCPRADQSESGNSTNSIDRLLREASATARDRLDVHRDGKHIVGSASDAGTVSRKRKIADKMGHDLSSLDKLALSSARSIDRAEGAKSTWPDVDIGEMLEHNMPNRLRGRADKEERPDQSRWRHLLDILRVEFLQDRDHPIAGRASLAQRGEPASLREVVGRSGRDVCVDMWKNVNLPEETTFRRPFGWQWGDPDVVMSEANDTGVSRIIHWAEVLIQSRREVVAGVVDKANQHILHHRGHVTLRAPQPRQRPLQSRKVHYLRTSGCAVDQFDRDRSRVDHFWALYDRFDEGEWKRIGGKETLT